ncbi:MAG: Mut7-C RNAse domain-containing protein [Candidatus Thermoplasmatota archaeon]
MKFLCDQMLGSLAKWLRILGFDTFYAKDGVTDEEIIDIAKNEQRTLLTRDKELVWRARRNNVGIIKIDSIKLDKQIKKVISSININKDEIKLLSRCTVCNTSVKKIEKTEIKEKVPIKVYNKQEKFWYCPKCDKVYWKGSHYDNIIKNLKKFF